MHSHASAVEYLHGVAALGYGGQDPVPDPRLAAADEAVVARRVARCSSAAPATAPIKLRVASDPDSTAERAAGRASDRRSRVVKPRLVPSQS